MGVSKVTLNGVPLMDVTDKTVDSDSLLYGETALRNDGETVSGAVVTAPASDVDPLMDGTASAGSASTYSRGDHVHPTDTSRAAANHVHGSITNDGKIASDTAVASGDKIVITDSSASNAVKRSGITFGANDNTFLRKDGSWGVPDGTYSLPTASAETLGGVKVGTNLSISEGVLSATDTTYTFDGTYNASTNKAATVSTVTNAINALDGGTIGAGSTTKTITTLSQTDGNVSATFENIAFPVTSVNGETGAVVLDAADVGALPDDTTIPQGTVTSVRVQATSPVQSSTSTAQSTTLNTTISLANGYGDTKNPYAAKNANKVLAGPTTGSDAVPSFRALVADDIPSITKSKISDFPDIPSKTSDLTNDSDFVEDASYVHTDNNFTATLKNKLDGIEAGATVDDHKWNDVSLVKSLFDDDADYRIPALPQVSDTSASLLNVCQDPGARSIPRRNNSGYLFSITPTAGDNSRKVATTAYVNGAISTLGSVLNFKGTKSTESALPSTGNKTGDVWIVTADNSEYVWNGSSWEKLGPTIDLSGYVPTSRTVNGKALSTDITLSASDVSAQASITANGILKGDGAGTITAATAGTDYVAPSALSDYMQKGVDYVTAGQLSGSTLGTGATAEGNSTTASGNYSHSEGYYTIASGNYSHAEGENCQATGIGSHAEGSSTKAQWAGAHAEGNNTLAYGANAHAEGYSTTANHAYQHVSGTFNILDDSSAAGYQKGNYVEIVGNGTAENARSNARTLDWSGNETLAGKLTVGTGPTNAMDVATKTYVDTAVSSVDALPSQTGQSGKFLTTNGTAASWASVTVPTKTSDLTNDSGFISAETDPTVPSWAKASSKPTYTASEVGALADTTDVTKWNGVTLNKGDSYSSNGDFYVPYLDSYNSSNAYTGKATATPAQGRLAKYDISAYLHSTTPSASDNSTKVATTAYVDSAISSVDALPSQSGQSGKFLTTNGTAASWSDTPMIKGVDYVTAGLPTGVLIGDKSTAEGDDTAPLGDAAHSEGHLTTALGNGSHAEGYNTEAGGNYSHAEGAGTNYTYGIKITGFTGTSGEYNWEHGSHVADETYVAGMYLTDDDRTFVERITWVDATSTPHTLKIENDLPSGTTYPLILYAKLPNAAGHISHSEGQNTIAIGDNSHSEGSTTIAQGEESHAEGYRTSAYADYSHSEGNYTTANGVQSHAEGLGTVSSGQSQHVFGEYNVVDTGSVDGYSRGDYVEIVGNGTAYNALSNARTLDWSGNEVLAGKLTVGAGPTNNMDVATKTYVDTAVSSVDALPSQTGNTGKFLTTNGTTASWATVTIPTYTLSISGNRITLTPSSGTASYIDLPVYNGTVV